MMGFHISEHNFLSLATLVSCLALVKKSMSFEELPHVCTNAANYIANSTFETNLELLLPSLMIKGPPTGFYNATVGDSPDGVFGLILCRGDVLVDECRNCLSEATKQIKQQCPNKKSGIIWYDTCMLRYSDQSFFSILDLQEKRTMFNQNNISNSDRFNRLLVAMLSTISFQAAFGPSKLMFATGLVNFSQFQKIHSLVQCTRDLSVEDCHRCLRTAISEIPNCCDKRRGGRVLLGSCNLRFEVYPFFEPLPTHARGRRLSRYVIAILVPVLIIIVVTVSGIFTYLLIKRREKQNPRVDTDRQETGNEESLYFHLNTIVAATSNFSNENKLGEGGFGPVYKGILLDGREIAVKRFSRNSGQGIEEFKNEVSLAATLEHRNLVRILGCCVEGEEKILVYEYMPNNSLGTFLFDPIKRVQLDWYARYKIIEGITRGLLYLHEDSPHKIVHQDLKANNILLDREFYPKIADFCMARIFGRVNSQGSINRVAGTYGYMAPEYAMHGQFSVKSDIFSFGVILLEIVSGQRSSELFKSEHGQDLLSYTWKHWREGSVLRLIDPALVESCVISQVFRCIHIGLLCVQEDPTERPTISVVNNMLSSHSVTLNSPSPPAFLLGISSVGSNDVSRN